MPKSCIVCKAAASLDLQLQYCDVCLSAIYCSTACQRIDWKTRHKKICKHLNVGHGDMQVRSDEHTELRNDRKEEFEDAERDLGEGQKRFFKLFQESTEEGCRVAARKVKKYAKRQNKHNQEALLMHTLRFLLRSDSEMLSWPNSPLLVLLQFVDPDVIFGHRFESPLHHLAYLADPMDYSTHEKQLILAKQLIEHGANVNAVSSQIWHETALHIACHSETVTNLDFVELLLEAGADPNAQDAEGQTPLMITTPHAPGAAKFLLNWSTTNVNITTRYGESFLGSVRITITSLVRSTITDVSDDIAEDSDINKRVKDQFELQQWRGIEEMLLERGAHELGHFRD